MRYIIPPGGRTEEVSGKDADLVGLNLEEMEIASDPRIVLRGYTFKKTTSRPSAGIIPRKAIIVYFQGKCYRLVPFAVSDNLPLNRQRRLFRLFPTAPASASPETLPPSPPLTLSEIRLINDYKAVCEYATACAEHDAAGLRGLKVPVIFVGHSLGTSIATVLLFQLPTPVASPVVPTTSTPTECTSPHSRIRCDGLIFENGFASIPGMVKALSPHFPYHHLGSFAFDRRSTLAALQARVEPVIPVAKVTTLNATTSGSSAPSSASSLLHIIPILFISSVNDEMVPPLMMRKLCDAAKEKRSEAQPGEEGRVYWLKVKGALHDVALQKEAWGEGDHRGLRGLYGAGAAGSRRP
ncbi:hypothetical protein QFC22_005992 [Naganishia vaughanmartiniae]|uniref:Uncharacterized protein n=1 Tax=Naganishia vaughanmartiniae TaxID=1424756 RepID=A0ACC2WQC5_9TREE|nr:hypothetical protein QFC22_005992 [Naganishia vaughanmartiniae]